MRFGSIGRFAGLHQHAQKRQLDAPRWTLAQAEPQDVPALSALVGLQYRQLPDGNFNHSGERERLLAIHRHCRPRHLGVLEQVVLPRITQQGAATVQEVLGWFPDESPALLVASVAHLLRNRKLTSDLDSSTWSTHTRLYIANIRAQTALDKEAGAAIRASYRECGKSQLWSA